MKHLITIFLISITVYGQKIELSPSIIDELVDGRYIRAGESNYVPFRSACYFPWVEGRRLVLIYDVDSNSLKVSGTVMQTNGDAEIVPYGKILIGLRLNETVEMPDLMIGETVQSYQKDEVDGVEIANKKVQYADSTGRFEITIPLVKGVILNFDFCDDTRGIINLRDENNEDEIGYIVIWSQLIAIGNIPEMYKNGNLKKFYK